MKKLAAPLLSTACALLAGCAAPQLPVSTSHVTESPRPAGAIPDPVQQSPALPPPRPGPRVETYSVTVHKVPVQSVLFALARDAGLNVDIHPSIDGMVTLNALDQTLPQLLARIARQVDMRYEIEGNNLIVLPDQPYWRNYKVDYVNMARSTQSSVSIATQISTTGGSSATQTVNPATGQTSTTTQAVGGGTNNSTTSVANRSDNNFWYSLEKNIRDMLRPTNLNDPLTDPLAQLREQTAGQQGQANPYGQAGQAGGVAGQPGVNPGGYAGGAGYPGAAQPYGVPQPGYPAAGEQGYGVAAGATGAQGAGRRNAPRNNNTVVVNQEGGLIAVRATSRQHDKIQEFLDTVLATAKRQVLIEATVIEVKLGDQYQQGINWSRVSSNGESTLIQGGVAAGANPLPNTTAPGFMLFKYNNPTTRLGNITAAVQLLESFGKVKVLSSPKISVMNNQTALLKVVDNNIFFTLKVTPAVMTSSGTIATPATYESKVETVPVGFVMSVTPQISESDEVTLNVRPTITRVVGFVQDPNPELAKQNVISKVPVIQARELESVMKVSSGQVAVMGGLMQDSVDNTKDGLPGVSSVPLLGNLFSYRNETASKTELVIFMRPIVVKDASLNGDYKDYRYLLPDQVPLNAQPYPQSVPPQVRNPAFGSGEQ
ncbi:pilus (MSHA type) biogenesis protein MshL [Massilia sp. MB5]|uniref:pilus (MSHA type) biogenesis protein MshL n=1 Tax=Massilia sp. MB5 TaxID=2919578 RepID=UPI001F0F10F5|nr:pilus (MSHA type) biogenesis protein MshL [Massilia sp. MB5]UMR29081.1 pilus (MSHA type) biogenesis protein MshL [Massilia sp. MB5]